MSVLHFTLPSVTEAQHNKWCLCDMETSFAHTRLNISSFKYASLICY